MPDLDPDCSCTVMVFLKEIFEKVDLKKKQKKNSRPKKNMQNYPACRVDFSYHTKLAALAIVFVVECILFIFSFYLQKHSLICTDKQNTKSYTGKQML